MLKSTIASALVAATLAIAAPAAAATITPVGVTASDTFPFFGEYKPENLINGSGLTGELHNANYANMWMTDLSIDAATLTFDLGGEFALDAIKVWNYNFGREEFASTLDRAANAFTLAISLDGLAFTEVLTGAFARGTGAPLGAETFDFAGRARFIRLGLNGNHQQYPEIYGYSPIGLSEVRFEGAAVPEPGVWALLICGFGGVGAVLRRRRTTASFA